MFFRTLICQARYRWGVTLLLFLAMTSLVTLYVYLRNTARFSNRSMQLIMKNLGHNMLVLPEDANPLDVYLCSDDPVLFSDRVTHNLAAHTELASRYYVSVLQKRVSVEGHEILLTGIEPVERSDETEEKGNMVKPLRKGQSRLGSSSAKILNVGKGEKIEILNRVFDVVEVLLQKGTEDDYRLYVPLGECQELLGCGGRINAILAFQCLSHGETLEEVEEYQQRTLSKAQPGFTSISRQSIAEGRYQARKTTQESLHYLLALVFTITIIVIAVTGLQEVSERRHEIGVYAALGAGYPYIISLFLSKILALAVFSSVVGFALGSRLAVSLNSSFLVVKTRSVQTFWGDLPSVMGLACCVALFAMIPPILQLLRLDPNEILTEE